MKIALITDTHFGIRNDQNVILQHMHWFFQHVFFPTLAENNIKTIIHLGDLVDRRKYINYRTLQQMKDSFLNEVVERGLDMHIITGNHDHYWRNTSKLNALSELLYGYNFNVIYEPDEVHIGGRDLIMLPWVTNESHSKTYDLLNKASSEDVVMGHLELSGFAMNPGSVAEHGDDPAPFQRLAGVYSGHYHTKSSKGNIHYLGAPFQFTWGDYMDPRGFHLLDLDTLELEFVENPYNMFLQLVYDDREELPTFFAHDKYVKVIVKHKTSQARFEKFLKAIDGQFPIDIKITETIELQVDSDEISGTESTTDIIRRYISNLDIPNKEPLEKLMMKLYEEALLSE